MPFLSPHKHYSPTSHQQVVPPLRKDLQTQILESLYNDLVMHRLLIKGHTVPLNRSYKGKAQIPEILIHGASPRKSPAEIGLRFADGLDFALFPGVLVSAHDDGFVVSVEKKDGVCQLFLSVQHPLQSQVFENVRGSGVEHLHLWILFVGGGINEGGEDTIF